MSIWDTVSNVGQKMVGAVDEAIDSAVEFASHPTETAEAVGRFVNAVPRLATYSPSLPPTTIWLNELKDENASLWLAIGLISAGLYEATGEGNPVSFGIQFSLF